MTIRSLLSRITKLEPKPVVREPPHHVFVEDGESEEQAVTRFRQQWPKLPKGHRLVLDYPPMTIDEWKAIAAEKARERQAKLIASAKSASAELPRDRSNDR